MGKQKAAKINSTSLRKSINGNSRNNIQKSKTKKATTYTSTKSNNIKQMTIKPSSSDFDIELNGLIQRKTQTNQKISKQPYTALSTSCCSSSNNNNNYNNNSSSSTQIVMQPSVLETFKMAYKVDAVNNSIGAFLSDHNNKIKELSLTTTTTSSSSSSSSSSSLPEPVLDNIFIVQSSIIASDMLINSDPVIKTKRNLYAMLDNGDSDDDEDHDEDDEQHGQSGRAIEKMRKKSKYLLKPSILGSYGALDDEI